MQKISLLFCALLFSCLLTAQTEINNNWKNQINPIFQGLNKSNVPNAILLDYAMEFTNVPAYNGTLTDSTYVDANILGNIYKTLFMGKVTTSTQYFPKLEDIASNWVMQRQNYNQTDKSTIVLAGLYYKYASLNPNALSSNKITVSNNKYYDKYINGVWQNPYLTKQTVAFASPVNRYNKRNFGVVLPQNLLLSNSANTIQSIQVNFNDGSGYKTVTIGQKVFANYTQNGTYDWTFKTTLTNGTVLYSKIKIKIDAPETSNNNQYRTTNFDNNVLISGPNSSFPSWANGAILRIDYAPSHNGQLTRPLIVAEGFDAGSILTPEIEGGDRTLFGENNFLESLQNTGDLRDLLLFDATQEYDIVYIDWQNGTNSIQHNSEVLKNVLAWVNTNKQGSEPNVLLGQSMGGVIGRYTLANMEAAQLTDPNAPDHEVGLFVAHDSPMQGANTPLSIQYFSRHAYDQYTSAPVLYGLVEIVIPTVLNLVELMSLGNLDIAFPSVEDVLTLQDTPAAMQMNYHYVDYSSNPTMAVHNAWQQEFENAGYPTQSRNIAISNGNECAVNHGFDPRAKFINLHDTHNPGFWGDLVHLVVTPLAGVLTKDLELTFLGLLPGSSKYFFDFDLYANPDVNEWNRQVYWGKIRYEKKLLWLVPISHTITERSKNAPNGYLPFDTYSGGYYDIENTVGDYSGYLPSNTIVNSRYGFIPVVSALDIKRNNGDVNPTDYLKNYAGGNTPEIALTSGFDNFIVDFMPNTPVNNAHISFQPRNGNWLAAELNALEDPTEDTPVFDCSSFCSPTINGPDFVCSSEEFSISADASYVYWSIIEGDHLVTLTSNGHTATISQNDYYQTGTATVQVFFSSKCGTASATKTITVGRPNITTNMKIIGNNINEANATAAINSNTQLSLSNYASGSYRYWIVPLNTQCQNPSPNNLPRFRTGPESYASEIVTSYTNATTFIDWGNCKGNYVVNVEALNECGSTGVDYQYVEVYDPYDGNPNPDPCDGISNLLVYPNPVNGNNVTVNRLPDNPPCEPTANRASNTGGNNTQIQNDVKIFNNLGVLVYQNVFYSEEFTITNLNLNTGFYILHFTPINEDPIQKVLVVE